MGKLSPRSKAYGFSATPSPMADLLGEHNFITVIVNVNWYKQVKIADAIFSICSVFVKFIPKYRVGDFSSLVELARPMQGEGRYSQPHQ